ncbi:CoA-binding protein [Brevibacillus humidisoli]|uniref:CoA-binding protein n=1 Tax=Brevibacillus humidisoli TaxID=2895522 RepID=UPI001E33B656|nr:CoA-binding protein [Brevibacillus humidisoli]UFJ39645.1 CoA-binding protein [Brevibacillus humidisoli]
MIQNPSDDARREILQNAKTIAVVGCSNKPERTSYMIAEALQQAGYRVIPVNPTIAGETVLGEEVVGSLADIHEPVDIVNVFRRSEQVMPVAEDAVKIKPKVLWMQQGIVNEEAAQLAKQNGIEVVMDRCIKVDHAILVPR